MIMNDIPSVRRNFGSFVEKLNKIRQVVICTSFTMEKITAKEDHWLKNIFDERESLF